MPLIKLKDNVREKSDFLRRAVCVQSRSRVVTLIFSRGNTIALVRLIESQSDFAPQQCFNEPLNHGILSNYA